MLPPANQDLGGVSICSVSNCFFYAYPEFLMLRMVTRFQWLACAGKGRTTRRRAAPGHHGEAVAALPQRYSAPQGEVFLLIRDAELISWS